VIDDSMLDSGTGNTYAELMTTSLQHTKWRLTPAAAISTFALALSLMAACLLLFQRQDVIEQAADRIYDVAMPTMVEAVRMVRGLERLAHAGEAVIWTDDSSRRAQVRHGLQSIAEDGTLQGDPALRTVVVAAFAVLDQNLAELAQKGNTVRAACLQRWQPIAQQLLDQSERIGTSASMSAIGDAQSIIEATQDSRDRLLLLAIATLGVFVISLILFFYLIVRPLIRLSRTLELAQAGYYGASREEIFREFQVLADAAEALADVQRTLIANKLELEQLAHTDALTGLANRRQFIASAEAALSRHERYGYPTSMIMFDLDHFKQINDRYGHEGGDAVLKSIGTGLSSKVRRVDLLARIGGEEFAVLLPEQGQAVANMSAQRLRAAIEAMEVETSSRDVIRFTASFGIAQHAKGESLEEFMHRADVALYGAKSAGRNRVHGAAEVALSAASTQAEGTTTGAI
jgi:diguanylate cyclase (GGDEF)-like protein